MPNIRVQALSRAALIVGDMGALADKLAISPEILASYLRGDVPVPANVFRRATEIISDSTVSRALNGEPSPSKRLRKK
jgi:DNA-binding transcriptional regulator YdaS (Cro superfamily)